MHRSSGAVRKAGPRLGVGPGRDWPGAFARKDAQYKKLGLKTRRPAPTPKGPTACCSDRRFPHVWMGLAVAGWMETGASPPLSLSLPLGPIVRKLSIGKKRRKGRGGVSTSQVPREIWRHHMLLLISYYVVRTRRRGGRGETGMRKIRIFRLTHHQPTDAEFHRNYLSR